MGGHPPHTRSELPVRFICETQLILRVYLEGRKKMHLLYKVIRADNATNLALDFKAPRADKGATYESAQSAAELAVPSTTAAQAAASGAIDSAALSAHASAAPLHVAGCAGTAGVALAYGTYRTSSIRGVKSQPGGQVLASPEANVEQSGAAPQVGGR